jgi:isoleucyl-tRNA synthetase
MKRESEVIDVWFDSGSMPYAQWHYPFENKEDFDYQFPADFIAEGVDQTRGWFYTLHAISTMLHGKPAFKNVIANGLVQDKNGQKMSKRLGNAVDPFETLAKYGADATRWYMVTNAPPWDNLKFNIEGIGEVQRKFFGTLYNTLSFFTRYADIDAYRYDANTAVDYNNRSELDQWMLSVYASTVEQCTSLLDDYDPTPAGRSIQTMMIDQVSNWYVRRSRRRFWKGDMTEDKKAAYDTLFEVLLGTAKLMAPIAPFYAEWMYDRLSTYTTEAMHDSVHLSPWPDASSMQSNQDLMLKMHVAQRLSSMVLGIRKAEKIRVRQPLSRILVPLSNEVTSELMQSIERIIQEEVNVKALELMPEDHPLMQRKAKANFKTLGRRLGKKMKATAACIAQLDSEELKELQQKGSMNLSVEGEVIDITEADVEWITEDIKGWSFVSEGNLSVALDVEVTEELRQEGLARELINRFQNLRKSSGLELTDRIDIFLEDSAWLKEVMDLHKSYIFAEILADTVHWGVDGMQAEVEIDEYQCTIGLKKTKS